MALNSEQAKQRIEDIAQSSATTRAAFEAYCGLCLAYAFGSQWAGVRAGSSGYGHSLQQLQTVVSSNRTDVRFSMNLIHSRIRKAMSKLMPREIQFQVEPASWAPNDQVAAMVADARMQMQLRQTSDLRALRKKDLWRTVFGSAVIRRTISSVGDPIILRDETGKPKKRDDGKPLTLRTFEHGWACCPPYEFVRDPAAHSVDFDGEDCIGHEKPRPLWWVQKHFGDLKMDVKAKMGQLLELQRFLHSATGQSLSSGPFDSKQQGVLFGEWWFRDDEKDKRRRWPHYAITVRDPAGSDQEARSFRIVHFGPNPFHGLPLHHFWYYDKAVSPWGIGIVAVAIQAQDAVNMAFNSAIRQLIRLSGPKMLIEEKSLVDSPRRALTNRIDVPILYKRNSAKPEYLTPPGLDGNATNILQSTPEWLDQLLNMSPVQRGEAVKRGEAFKAYQLRSEMADTDFNAISDTDEGVVNDLLTGTLFDVIRTDDPRAVANELSHEFTLNQINTLFSQDIEKSISGVIVTPDSLRPKSPSELRDSFMTAANSGLIQPDAARRSLLVQGKYALDVKEQRAYRKQTLEIQNILGGKTVNVLHAQDHDMHQWRLSMEFESPRSSGYSNEQLHALVEHWELHEEARLQLLAVRARRTQVEEGQPPQQSQGQIPPQSPQEQIIPFPGSNAQPAGMGGPAAPMMPQAGAALQPPIPSGPPALAGAM